MNIKKIKELRNRISIPLNRAVELLKENNEDIFLCEKVFHRENIKSISKIVECNEKIAKEYYLKFDYNIKKSIEKINDVQEIFTTRENQSFKNEIGYILYPENLTGETYNTVKRNDVFIPAYDFDLIIKEFQSVFPQINPISKSIETSFDIYGHNYFSNETCKKIVEKISNIYSEDTKINLFLQEILKWFNEKLKYANYIVVFGNL